MPAGNRGIGTRLEWQLQRVPVISPGRRLWRLARGARRLTSRAVAGGKQGSGEGDVVTTGYPDCCTQQRRIHQLRRTPDPPDWASPLCRGNSRCQVRYVLGVPVGRAVIAEPGQHAGRATTRHHRNPHMQIVLHGTDIRKSRPTARRSCRGCPAAGALAHQIGTHEGRVAGRAER